MTRRHRHGARPQPSDRAAGGIQSPQEGIGPSEQHSVKGAPHAHQSPGAKGGSTGARSQPYAHGYDERVITSPRPGRSPTLSEALAAGDPPLGVGVPPRVPSLLRWSHETIGDNDANKRIYVPGPVADARGLCFCRGSIPQPNRDLDRRDPGGTLGDRATGSPSSHAIVSPLEGLWATGPIRSPISRPRWSQRA